MRTLPRWMLLVLLVVSTCLGMVACRQDDTAATRAPVDTGAARKPAQAVRQLTAHLRANQLDGFAREAVPPAIHARLEAAWGEGRTRWPLDELPFGRRLPDMLAALSAPGAEQKLQQTYDRQFAGAGRELRSAATALGQFGAQYVAAEGDYSDDERQHYAQLIIAISQWGLRAPLGDRVRARQSIAELSTAARRTHLDSEAAFRRAGMEASLRRIGPFAAALKHALQRYGLDLDADLGTLDASLLQQTGDTAQVRMRYRLAGQDIDTVVSLRRIDGRWYLSDYLRHAEAALARPPKPAPAAVATPVPRPRR